MIAHLGLGTDLKSLTLLISGSYGKWSCWHNTPHSAIETNNYIDKQKAQQQIRPHPNFLTCLREFYERYLIRTNRCPFIGKFLEGWHGVAVGQRLEARDPTLHGRVVAELQHVAARRLGERNVWEDGNVGDRRLRRFGEPVEVFEVRVEELQHTDRALKRVLISYRDLPSELVLDAHPEQRVRDLVAGVGDPLGDVRRNDRISDGEPVRAGRVLLDQVDENRRRVADRRAAGLNEHRHLPQRVELQEGGVRGVDLRRDCIKGLPKEVEHKPRLERVAAALEAVERVRGHGGNRK
mmetsp:Transcript_87564/g.157834  ORF Transcript_87564/g.157834 Transcript_87564/m.157834 type:complete len:294 (-) Transcript_87564:72-953(-)